MTTKLYVWLLIAILAGVLLYAAKLVVTKLETNAYERGLAEAKVVQYQTYEVEFQKQLERSKEIDLNIERLTSDDVMRILRERDELQQRRAPSSAP